jgi:hypothetical protein
VRGLAIDFNMKIGVKRWEEARRHCMYLRGVELRYDSSTLLINVGCELELGMIVTLVKSPLTGTLKILCKCQSNP